MLSPVRLSVRHTGGSVKNGEVRIMQLSPQSSPRDSSFLTHREIPKGTYGAGRRMTEE